MADDNDDVDLDDVDEDGSSLNSAPGANDPPKDPSVIKVGKSPAPPGPPPLTAPIPTTDAEDENDEEPEEVVKEPEPVKEPVYIEPLGVATEEVLAKDLTAWILEKQYRQGKLSIKSSSGIDPKIPGEGGSSKYEDYKWQLDKMFRTVPEDMSLGKVRLKPDELLYEGEKWVLGRLFRELREEDGYIPQAEKEESVIDLSDAMDVQLSGPDDPLPCKLNYPVDALSDENMKCIQVEQLPVEDKCTTRVANPNSGKVYEFAYSPVMSVAVESTCEGEVENCIPPPITPHDLAQGNNCPSSSRNCGPSSGTGCCAPPADNTVSGRCRNNLRCDSTNQSVCQAERSAMAIYDTLTGCDNFPCNIGDRPNAEMTDIQDSVWTWLYQIILRMTPIDENQNSTNSQYASNTSPRSDNNEDPCCQR